MMQAKEHTWTIVISNVDRSEMSRAFRYTKWQDTWFDRTDRIDDDEYSMLMVSIDVANIDELIELLKCCENVKPSWGIQLCLSADFGSVRFNANLCTSGTVFNESSASMNQTNICLAGALNESISRIETELHQVRILAAARGVMA